MKYLYNFLKGILIGTGAILPGISSGVLCVIFGIYDKIVFAIMHFFNDVKNNFKFIFPISSGIIVGIVLFGNILKLLFENYSNQTKFAFIGLILGSIPLLIKQVNTKKHSKKNIIFFIFTFSISLFLIKFEKIISINFTSNINYLYLCFCGFAMSIGVVVPGVSSTIILMILGIYNIYLSSVSELFLPILVPIGIGLILGSIIFLKLIEFLFKNFYIQTYYSIIGFVCGSIFVLYEPIKLNFTGFTCLICLIFGFILSKFFDKN